MIRLIGIDIDGTLLDHAGRVPQANIDAIQAALSAGIHIVLVTGRSYPWALPVVEQLPAPVSLIVSNGAIERAADGTLLEKHLLPAGTARKLLDDTRHLRASTALIFDRLAEGQIVFETMNWDHPQRRGYFERNRRLIARADRLEDALIEDPVQVMFNGAVDAMRDLERRLVDLELYSVSVTSYEARDFTLIDVTARTATKGQALMRRARALGLEREHVMAVGDNFNDIEMLEAVGLPVVMGNAHPALLSYGWAVTGHQDAAGLAQAIRDFALG